MVSLPSILQETRRKASKVKQVRMTVFVYKIQHLFLSLEHFFFNSRPFVGPEGHEHLNLLLPKILEGGSLLMI